MKLLQTTPPSASSVVSLIKKKTEELQKIPGLYEFVLIHGFLAGGAVRDLTLGGKPKDWDIFFKSKSSVDEFIKRFGKKMEETGIGNYNYKDFQFITIRHGSPREVIDTFDWSVNRAFYDYKASQLHSHNVDKHLRFNTKSDKPLSAILRLPYLLKKGFEIEEKELLYTLSFIASAVDLKSSEAVSAQYEFMSSGGGRSCSDGIVERAVHDAKEMSIKKSPLNKALM